MSYEDLPKLKMPYGQEVFISDSTLRDGFQMPGLMIMSRDKLKIFEYLHRIGVDKIELFLYTESDREVAREMIDCSYEKPEVTGWSRCNPLDIDLILSMDDIRETGLLMSISDAHIFTKMGLKDREAAEEKYLGALEYALDHGLRARAHLEDITRADLEGFVYPLVQKILERDPETIIRLCDTLGFGVPFENVIDPYSIPCMVRRLRELGVKNIETHIHDDFGFGTSSSIAAYWYGANWSNLTFLGIGERAGNAELEKVLLFLVQRVEGFQKYDLACLSEFAEYVSENVGIYIPRNKAVVGRNIFAHESGIHTAGVIKSPYIYEPYPPELVGCKRTLMIGPTSGAEVVRFKIKDVLKRRYKVEIDIEKDDWRIQAITSEIKDLYMEEKRRSCISDEEIADYAMKYSFIRPIKDREMNFNQTSEAKEETPLEI
jgi:isopropylmalate/homocitrate/citramalate synthase